MKSEYAIILGAFSFGILVWVFDSTVDSLLFYEDTFFDLLILNVPRPEMFFRFQVMIFFTLFGILISYFFSRQRKAEESLREVHKDLEYIIEERTAKLRETVKLLSTEASDRLRAENNMKDSRNMLAAVFDGISDPLILMDSGLTIKLINKAASEYYGLSGASLPTDSKCHQFLKDSPLPCDGCEIPEVLKSGQFMQFERKGFVDPERMENVYVYPVQKKEDNSWDILLRIKDVTEQRLFEKQAIHNEKMIALGVLITSIAHELKNPIGFISFNLPILKSYISELMPILETHAAGHPEFEMFNMPYSDFKEDLFKLLDNLEHGSNRIEIFVSNMKAFGQTKFNVDRRWIDLRSVINNMIEANHESLFKGMPSFDKIMPDSLPEIWSDPFAIEQILLNLLNNAAHASRTNGSRIVLRVEVRDNWLNRVLLEVKDNGIGMDENTKKKIFDPFFSMKSPREGTGLGLYVCQGLVNSLNGRIEVDSEPGKGSVFRVILPDKERRGLERS